MNMPIRRLTVLALLAAAGPAAAYETRFPLRGDAFDPGTYLRTGGHTGTAYGNSGWWIDFHAARWDGNNWQKGDGPTNEDQYIYGARLYAPEDGWVVGCWRTAPDKPAPGVNYDFDLDGVADSSPMKGGNHVLLLKPDGTHLTFFGHMKDDSIPSSICPMPADRDEIDVVSVEGQQLPGPDGWPDDLGAPSCDPDPDWAAFRRGTVLPTPVWVEAGTYLGEVGHSGASTNPHLHMHARPVTVHASGYYCEGPSEEILFSEAWSAVCNAGENIVTPPWLALNDDNPLEAWALGGTCDVDTDCVGNEVCYGEDSPDVAPNDGTCTIPTPVQCFMTDAFGTQADAHGMAVPATNLNLVTDADGATVVYESSGNMRLASFDIDANGGLTLIDTQNEGAVGDFGVARPISTSQDVVVSIQGSNGLLKHIPYDVNNGQITRMNGKELTEGTVSRVASTPSPTHNGFVVAVENVNGNLQVNDYDVDGALNIVRQQPSSGGGAIEDVAITTTSVFDGVVTAELTSSNGLVVRSFAVPASGGVTAADSYFAFLAGSSVRVETVPAFLHEFVVTSVIQMDDTLRLDSWEIDSDGDITWLDTISAGTVSAHDLVSPGPGDLVSAVRDSDDNYRMMGFKVDLEGGLRRTATKVLSGVTEAAIGHHGSHLVAARTDGSGDLVMYSWNENFSYQP